MKGAATVRDAAHDRRQRRMLVGLALLFFAPLGLSFYLYYSPAGWRPGSRVNHGDLIDPPRPLPDQWLPSARDGKTGPKLTGKWTLLYVGAGGCNALCRSDLHETRQVRTALNRDMDRVQRVFVALGECCDWQLLDAQHPDLLTVRAGDAAAVLGGLPSFNGVAPAAAERVYLIDPLGNLMMSYAPDAPPKGMLTDLKRLLGLSHVG
jgi:hypothetical protein